MKQALLFLYLKLTGLKVRNRLQGLETGLSKISTGLAGIISEKNQKSMHYFQEGLCLDSVF